MGYGGYQRTTAHRVAWELTYGPIPEGQIVRHSCDNPRCCNPAHLLTGTYQDNTDDMMERKRWHQGNTPRGSTHHLAKLTDADVVEIRRLYAAGSHSQRKLARLFGVTQASIGKIVRRESRKDVP
jgi:Autographiviridae endonuclease